MAIIYHAKENIFQLNGKSSTYLLGVFDNKYLMTFYYGKKIEMVNPERLMVFRELGFSPSPNEYFKNRSISLDTMPQEYP